MLNDWKLILHEVSVALLSDTKTRPYLRILSVFHELWGLREAVMMLLPEMHKQFSMCAHMSVTRGRCLFCQSRSVILHHCILFLYMCRHLAVFDTIVAGQSS